MIYSLGTNYQYNYKKKKKCSYTIMVNLAITYSVFLVRENIKVIAVF